MESLGPPGPSSLERLPLDILEYICRFLGPRSLASLSLVSRPCCLATERHRFSRLKFSMHTPPKLRHELEQWTAILDRGDRFRHVRRVVVAGALLDPDDPERARLDYLGRRSSEQDGLGPERDNERDDYDSDFKRDRFFEPWQPALTPHHKQRQHENWLPFAQFLARLPGLADFFYTCTHQMPGCVLESLHTHHPNSRLHLATLGLRSLFRATDKDVQPMDPDEFALATSPCLYSIHTVHGNPASNRMVNLNMEALAAMVCGWAPGLKRLSVKFNATPREKALSWAPGAPWEAVSRATSPVQQRADHSDAFLALPQAVLLGRRRARLEALTLSGRYCYEPAHLQTWGNLTDFGALRRFGFHCIAHPLVFAELASLAEAGTFRSLRELHLSVTVFTGGDHEVAQMDGWVSRFLQALPPLEELNLFGCYGEASLEAALRCHGPGVRKLAQLPLGDMRRPGSEVHLIGPERIREFEQRCPGLEEVRCRLPRSGGGPEEVAMYRALGRLPRLRRIRLVFDCYPPIGGAESLADAVVRVLANAASDEALGRAIAHEIVSGADDSPLEHLRIDMVIPHQICGEPIPYLDRVLGYVGRSVVCLRDEARGPPKAHIVAERWRRGIRQRLDDLPPVGRKAWGKLWPRRTEDWRDDWHSFPLSSESRELP